MMPPITEFVATPYGGSVNAPGTDRAVITGGWVPVAFAEGTGLKSSLLLWMPLGLQGFSDRLNM